MHAHEWQIQYQCSKTYLPKITFDGPFAWYKVYNLLERVIINSASQRDNVVKFNHSVSPVQELVWLCLDFSHTSLGHEALILSNSDRTSHPLPVWPFPPATVLVCAVSSSGFFLLWYGPPLFKIHLQSPPLSCCSSASIAHLRLSFSVRLMPQAPLSRDHTTHTMRDNAWPSVLPWHCPDTTKQVSLKRRKAGTQFWGEGLSSTGGRSSAETAHH